MFILRNKKDVNRFRCCYEKGIGAIYEMSIDRIYIES